MSKGQFGSIRGVAAVVVAAAVAWVGCNQWQGVELTESSLVSPNGATTEGGDEMRSHWYNDQPGLDPAIVGGPNFKRLFRTALPAGATDKALAQPLVLNSSGKVFVVTEGNNLYLLDPVSGAITNSRSLGAGFDTSPLGCGDIQPTVGITGTPVVDTSSNTAYFFSKSSAGVYTLHAVDAATLAEKGGFPVTISGAAQNAPAISFDSTDAHQRPGLLLMGGVVYGAFASHCDHRPYRGWIIGVSTAGVIKTRFSTETVGEGAGIWMSGTGLMSDGAGQIVFATGNGYAANTYPAPLASNAPPGALEEAAVRAVVQADGSLTPTDFFAPHEAKTMGDNDLAGGGIIGLPSQFGTTTFPRTATIVGKGGILYLLNRDKLGGFQQGANLSNDVLTEVNLNGGTWGHPAVWPGDGGYIFVDTNGGADAQTGYQLRMLKNGVNGTKPTLSLLGYATNNVTANPPPIDNFGAYAGSPIVTSNGTTGGSAVIWCVGNSQLRAYKISGNYLASIFTDSITTLAKFQTVGVGGNRVYVGTGDGFVIGYGAGTATVSGAPLAFGTVAVGQQTTMTATITANQNLTIPAGGLTSTNGVFTLGASTPALPATLASGASLTVPVTFKPTVAGATSGALNVAIQGGGGGSVSLSGTGQVNSAQVNVNPSTVAFGGIVTGSTATSTILIQNTGTQTLTFAAMTAPAAPFSATGVPASGATLAAGASVSATVTFAPTAAGSFSGSLGINTTNGGNVTVALTDSAGAAAKMVITPLSLDYGSIAAGSSKSMSFTIQNTGGIALQIATSKPPVLGQFSATTTLNEGSSIPAGGSVTETVKLTSTTPGSYTDQWGITGSDNTATRTLVTFTGTVTPAVAALPRTGWIATVSNISGDVAANMLDGNLATRWSSGAAMAAGMWVQIDMGAANSVSQIVMDSNGSGDYARAFDVYVSNTAYTGGATTGLGAAVTSGTATASPVSASFTAKSGRYIVVVMGTVPTGVTSWWSIHEFNAYGTSGGGGTGGSGGGGSGGGGSGGGGAGGSGGSVGTALINAGGPAAAPYVADIDFTGGGTINHANAIDVSGVTNPAPTAVYQTARTGNFTYTIPGFAAGSSHTVRLHMCETFFSTAGSRKFNVTLNGTQVMTGFDIFAATGAKNKAIAQQITSNANGSGQYVIQFTSVVDNSLVSGIEIQ
ncbi:MAG: hypothetical protein JWM82_1479 [Myxococcales bacterium]|nr:hypothetical protein [Myxococcales bacterium]